jgi:single-strand DNA-binding protein
MYLNKVELIGFIGSDAETKTTPQGKAVTTFSIASTTSYIKDCERQSRSQWHRIEV